MLNFQFHNPIQILDVVLKEITISYADITKLYPAESRHLITAIIIPKT